MLLKHIDLAYDDTCEWIDNRDSADWYYDLIDDLKGEARIVLAH